MRFRLIAAASMAVLAGAAYAQPPGAPHSGGRAGGFELLQFDANADGKLSRTEFDAGQRSLFEAIDSDHNAAATPEEFQASAIKQRDAIRAFASADRFTALDTDKSGQLSKAEFAAGSPGKGRDGAHSGPREASSDGGPPHGRIGRGPGPGRGGPQDIGARGGMRIDADADGKVTLAEFSARGAEAFSRADANKDGVVTVAELQALRPALR